MGTTPRFQKALDKALADWAAADPARCAGLAGCEALPGGVLVPFFGRPHLVTHPEGRVAPLSDEAARAAASGGAPAAPSGAQGKPVHVSIVILLLALPADRRRHAARRTLGAVSRDPRRHVLRAGLRGPHRAAPGPPRRRPRSQRLRRSRGRLSRRRRAHHGVDLDLADAALRFWALPHLPVAALLWAGDDEFPGRAAILFDEHAHHYLPIEDLSGMGEWLAHRLARG